MNKKQQHSTNITILLQENIKCNKNVIQNYLNFENKTYIMNIVKNRL